MSKPKEAWSILPPLYAPMNLSWKSCLSQKTFKKYPEDTDPLKDVIV